MYNNSFWFNLSWACLFKYSIYYVCINAIVLIQFTHRRLLFDTC